MPCTQTSEIAFYDHNAINMSICNNSAGFMPQIRGFPRSGCNINLYLEEAHPLIYMRVWYVICKSWNTVLYTMRTRKPNGLLPIVFELPNRYSNHNLWLLFLNNHCVFLKCTGYEHSVFELFRVFSYKLQQKCYMYNACHHPPPLFRIYHERHCFLL